MSLGSSSIPSRGGGHSASRRGCQHVDPVARIASRRVTRFHGAEKSISPVVADLGRHERDQLLELGGDVVVVRVGLVPLEHRELGVVLGREALVAEVLAQLVDALEPADDQPLEVQLGGDPQVEVAVERVVVGGERPRQRAAVERLQHRRLDLQEAALVEPAAHRRDHLRAQDEQLARLLVGDQVELAAAVAGLGVLEPVELVRRRRERLGQQLPAGGRQRQLAAAALEGGAVDPDDVAEVERRSARRRTRRRARPCAPAPGSARSGRSRRGTPPCRCSRRPVSRPATR